MNDPIKKLDGEMTEQGILQFSLKQPKIEHSLYIFEDYLGSQNFDLEKVLKDHEKNGWECCNYHVKIVEYKESVPVASYNSTMIYQSKSKTVHMIVFKRYIYD